MSAPPDQAAAMRAPPLTPAIPDTASGLVERVQDAAVRGGVGTTPAQREVQRLHVLR
jgi:hypothetical protein